MDKFDKFNKENGVSWKQLSDKIKEATDTTLSTDDVFVVLHQFIYDELKKTKERSKHWYWRLWWKVKYFFVDLFDGDEYEA